MKKMTKIAVLSSTLLLATVTAAGIAAQNKGETPKTDIEEKLNVGGKLLSSFTKRSAKPNDIELGSQIFTQVMNVEGTKYLRFAVAVDVHRTNEVSITRHVSGLDDHKVTFDKVYKGLKTETGGLYYDSTTKELTSDVALWDTNYYLASYSIELTEASEGKSFSAVSEVVDIDSNIETSKPLETTYAIETAGKTYKVEFKDEYSNTLMVKKVAEGQKVSPVDYSKAGGWMKDGSLFDLNTAITEDIELVAHVHNYGELPTVEFNDDCSKATFTFECGSCIDGLQNTTVITVDTTNEPIEKGRLTPGGIRYNAEVEFLGKTYSDHKDVLDESYMWIAGSTGSPVAEIDRDETTGNVILNAVLTSGDTTFKLDPEYDNAHNKVEASMVQLKFKILSTNDTSSVWYVNQIDGYSGFGKEKMEIGSTVTIVIKVGSEIIFRFIFF